ncbi:hypothetical protein [Microlunatus parietis]|uniref:Uncharacterized protein n=1 Tax=Microlunatus parietis TaxID=682979 RepID=A0A7Y9IDV6_9ACTN|nr:hypothetical protein [Microlunatus parietis]NYE75072.1 hypothetical protein [Microlunatus parietis]
MGTPARRWELIVWCSLTFVAELGALLVLATGAAMLIMGIRMYYGPWADPPGTDELHVALMALATVVTVVHTVVRWKRGTVPE